MPLVTRPFNPINKVYIGEVRVYVCNSLLLLKKSFAFQSITYTQNKIENKRLKAMQHFQSFLYLLYISLL